MLLTVTKDVEAQRTTSSQRPIERSPSDYAHVGRGGAGNWATSSGSQQVQVSNASRQSEGVPTVPRRDKTIASYGRGGAGNVVKGEGEKKGSVAVDDKSVKERRRVEQVVRDVEMELKQPERAHLGRSVDTIGEEEM